MAANAATAPLGSHLTSRQLVVNLSPKGDPRALVDAAGRYKGTAHLLFSHTREQLALEARDCEETMKVSPPDLACYYRVRVDEERLAEVRDVMSRVDGADGAYLLPPVATPTHLCGRLTPLPQPPPVPTPSFVARQRYLEDASAGGVDAVFAWSRPGGRGTGVEIVHIEAAWNFGHEDLVQNQGGALGTQSTDFCLRQHGTAVLGVLGGDQGARGVTGVCPDARVRTIGVEDVSNPEGPELPTAIRRAANALRAGDIILIELQHPGARVAHLPNEDRHGYIPVEWWPPTLAAIQFATAKGIIVVEAAGNGDENLDDEIHDRGDIFPASWKNPFRRATARSDSGAILVGAGAPPPGTHGRNWGPERSRLEFSNYGLAVDVQGWGREVTTCGYGSLQGGPSENRWYTDEFAGTSSASPMVAGVLACLQGIQRARRAPLLTPATARALLRDTGWPQQSAEGRPASQRIGSRPDLSQLIAKLP